MPPEPRSTCAWPHRATIPPLKRPPKSSSKNPASNVQLGFSPGSAQSTGWIEEENPSLRGETRAQQEPRPPLKIQELGVTKFLARLFHFLTGRMREVFALINCLARCRLRGCGSVVNLLFCL